MPPTSLNFLSSHYKYAPFTNSFMAALTNHNFDTFKHSLSLALYSLAYSMKLQRLTMEMATLILVITTICMPCCSSRLLISMHVRNHDEVSKASLKETDQTEAVAAEVLSVDDAEPTDMNNHHSLPRQSFGDWGNDPNQNEGKSGNRTNDEKKN